MLAKLCAILANSFCCKLGHNYPIYLDIYSSAQTNNTVIKQVTFRQGVKADMIWPITSTTPHSLFLILDVL